MTFGLDGLLLALLAFMIGFLGRGDFDAWRARRRYRCGTCGARTDDDGIGAGDVDGGSSDQN